MWSGIKIDKRTGNIAAVQRQLGHTNAGNSIQYARVTDQELADALDDRPFRNRAIVYTLIETGMRRAAVRNIDLEVVDFERRIVNVEEKGGRSHGYKVSRERDICHRRLCGLL